MCACSGPPSHLAVVSRLTMIAYCMSRTVFRRQGEYDTPSRAHIQCRHCVTLTQAVFINVRTLQRNTDRSVNAVALVATYVTFRALLLRRERLNAANSVIERTCDTAVWPHAHARVPEAARDSSRSASFRRESIGAAHEGSQGQ